MVNDYACGRWRNAYKIITLGGNIMNKKISTAILAVLILAFVGILIMRSSTDSISETPTIEAAATTPAPTPTPTPTPTPSPEPTPEPTPEPDWPDIDITDWQYVLANTANLLDSDFAPEMSIVEGSFQFDSRAVDALNDFIAAGRAEGLSVVLSSAYRSYDTQSYLFTAKVAQYGGDEATAATIVAIPGSSEHQTGLAVDIVDKYYEYMNESLADTDLSKWMYENCAEYGFILRFPEDKQEITGIMFEPWHYRYVGIEAATYIMEKGICLEEFVELYV